MRDFDDSAATMLADNSGNVSGRGKPAGYKDDAFPDSFLAPAPAGPSNNAQRNIFNGLNPNGLWRLFVVDDFSGDTGSFSRWGLQLTTEDESEPSAHALMFGGVLSVVAVRRDGLIPRTTDQLYFPWDITS